MQASWLHGWTRAGTNHIRLRAAQRRGCLCFTRLLHRSCRTRGRSCVGLVEAQNSPQPHFEAQVTADEYKLTGLLDEVENYRAMKEEPCRKHVSAAGSDKKRIDQTGTRSSLRVVHQKTRLRFSVTCSSQYGCEKAPLTPTTPPPYWV